MIQPLFIVKSPKGDIWVYSNESEVIDYMDELAGKAIAFVNPAGKNFILQKKHYIVVKRRSTRAIFKEETLALPAEMSVYLRGDGIWIGSPPSRYAPKGIPVVVVVAVALIIVFGIAAAYVISKWIDTNAKLEAARIQQQAIINAYKQQLDHIVSLGEIEKEETKGNYKYVYYKDGSITRIDLTTGECKIIKKPVVTAEDIRNTYDVNKALDKLRSYMQEALGGGSVVTKALDKLVLIFIIAIGGYMLYQFMKRRW